MCSGAARTLLNRAALLTVSVGGPSARSLMVTLSARATLDSAPSMQAPASPAAKIVLPFIPCLLAARQVPRLLGHSSSPLAQGSSSLGQPSSPLGQPSSSLGQPSSSLGQPSSSLGQPSWPLGQPSSPLGQPSSTLGKTSRSMTAVISVT